MPLRLPGSSIRSKVALATMLLVATISGFIYLYFPAKLQQNAERLIREESESVTRLAAVSVAQGLERMDKEAVEEALTALREDSDIAYVIVRDRNGRLFASFNETRTGPPEPRPDPTIYQSTAPVEDRGRKVGEIHVGLSTERAVREVEQMRSAVSTMTAIIFAIGILFAFAIGAAIAQPLRAMAQTARRIAGGHLKERAEIDGTREVAQLAKSFNVMLERVESAQEELASLNSYLEQRVEERTRELREEMTERRRAERRYRLLFERNLSGVYIASIEGRILSCNDACARMLGYETGEELVEKRGSMHYFDAAEQQAVVEELLQKGSVVNHEARLLRYDGDVIWVLETLSVGSDHGDTPSVEGVILDITDRKRTEQEVEFQAYHDALTGLPNRMLFIDRLTVALSQARRRQQPLAVMFLDLDDLKIVNDTLGHAAGDQVLQMTGDRLVACLRQEDTVARMGGDEFTLLLPAIDTVADAVDVAQKVTFAIQQPFVLGDDEVRVTTSIGVAMYPVDGEDPETLLANADATMYRVKENGGAAYQLCSGAMPRRALGRMTMEESLRHALEAEEFAVYYQPIVNSGSREVVGAEALVRWVHPESGLIEPSGFISLAEYTGLIIPIGEWVFREACRQVRAWHEQGIAELRLAVNVSARQFHQRDFIGRLRRALDESGLGPQYLELEITETMAMQKSDRTIDMLQRLREQGIGITLDDFGTGQSSLTYLKRFPIDSVKIDRSFVSGIHQAIVDAPIVEAILHLASSMGLRTVGEGIETAEQWDFLAARGCTEMQGFYISPPLDAQSFVNFIDSFRTDLSDAASR